MNVRSTYLPNLLPMEVTHRKDVPPMPAQGTAELILEEARTKRDKQDRQLQALLRLATGALIVVLSAGTIAVAVNQDLAAHAAVIAFGAVILLGLNLIAIEITAHNWKDGPSIAWLVSLYRRRRPSLLQLQVVLISRLRRDHAYNKKTLRRVRQLVAVQALIAFLGIVILLLGFYELT